jgi:hypothetical protein
MDEVIAALDAVGANLAFYAREIFGEDYLDKVFRDGDGPSARVPSQRFRAVTP